MKFFFDKKVIFSLKKVANINEFSSFLRNRMAAMLSKFRIDYSDVIVITDITKKPEASTRSHFNDLIKDFVTAEGDNGT